MIRIGYTTIQTRLSRLGTRLALVALAGLVLAVPGYAQNTSQKTPPAGNEPPQWYQVEVFIFANDSPAAGGPEIWPENVELSYPEHIVRLSEENTNAPDSESQPGAGDTSTPDASAPPSPEQPFVALGKDQWQLGDIAARISAQKDFRPLFHAAWRQPAANSAESQSVLIRGGDAYDDHRELEGWVKLSVERYLHFETDLWLSTFKSTAGLEQMPWPKLPRLPFTSSAQLSDEAGPPAITDTIAEPTPTNPSFFDFRHRQYVVDRTVVLRQSRKMRSGELHYIDHPLMGVLVKVIPYQPKVTDETPGPDDGHTEPPTPAGQTPASH